MSIEMDTTSINPYNWLSEAMESLERGRANAPLLSQVVMPLALEARPFSLPPYVESDPPYMGYLFESEPAVARLDKYHQPYPVIALQYPFLDDRDDKIRVPTVAIISHNEGTGELLVSQANRLMGDTKWTWVPVGLAVKVDGPLNLNMLLMRPYYFRNRGLSREEAQMCVNAMQPAVMAAYELAVLIKCQNVSILHLEAPAKVNEKRKRKGKRPLPDGYVIRVSRNVTRMEYDVDDDDDGTTRTHASPRTHFRRGHIRRLQSGATVWVSPTVVNPGNTPLDSKYQILF